MIAENHIEAIKQYWIPILGEKIHWQDDRVFMEAIFEPRDREQKFPCLIELDIPDCAKYYGGLKANWKSEWPDCKHRMWVDFGNGFYKEWSE